MFGEGAISGPADTHCLFLVNLPGSASGIGSLLAGLWISASASGSRVLEEGHAGISAARVCFHTFADLLLDGHSFIGLSAG